MKKMIIKDFNKDEILSLYYLVTDKNVLHNSSKVLSNKKEIYELLESFSTRYGIEMPKTRKFIIDLGKYFLSDEWKEYENIKSKEDCSKFFQRIYQRLKNENLIRSNYPKVFEYWKQEDDEPWKIFIFRVKNNIDTLPRCSCGKPVKIISSKFTKDCGDKECHKKVLQDIWNNKTPEEKTQKLERFKETCKEKYGVENPNQCRQVREKLEQTNLQRYGVKYTTQSEAAKIKKEETFLRKYGVKNPNMLPEIRAKGTKTCMERYGVPNPNQAAISRKSTLERYGVENYNWLHLPPETPIIIHDGEKLKNYLIERQGKTVIEIAEELGMSSYALWGRIHQFDLDSYVTNTKASTPEKKLKEFILNNYSGNIIYNSKQIIPPFELDIYLPDKNLAFEFNGNYWHSEVMLASKSVSPKEYHQIKTKMCKEKGIRLIHIFEYEWDDLEYQNKLKDYMQFLLNGPSTRIYARKCVVKEVEYGEVKEFLDRNHLQGAVNSSVNLGLFSDNKLVEVMTFSKPRFSKKYEWELMRLASEKGYQVVGGASKLLTFFKEKYQPTSIVSYCNLSKMSGNVYEQIGFKLKDITDPNYVWVRGKEVLTRYQCQKHKLLQEGFEGDSEFDIMSNRGYFRIFDSGNLVYVM